MEEDLQGEQRLARAGLSGDNAERPDRQPASEDAIEGGAPGREPLQLGWGRAQFRSSRSAKRSRSRSSRIYSRCWMTIWPVISTRSGRSSPASSRSASGVPSDLSFQAGGNREREVVPSRLWNHPPSPRPPPPPPHPAPFQHPA